MTHQNDAQPGDSWGPWTIHDGRGCPLPAGTLVEIVYEDRFGFATRRRGRVSGDAQSSWDWSYFPQLMRIVRYRQKRPPGMVMLDKALRIEKDRSQSAPKRVQTPAPVSAN